MGKIILAVCDSCDCRDRLDDGSLPRNGIETVRIQVFVGAGDPSPKRYNEALMLCERCRDELDTAILRAITQKPCRAEPG